MSKPLNIGMIGYGFMGRAHSNAYCKVNHFFNLEYRPVLKAACARSLDKAKEFAANWGYESVETDWRKLIERKDIDVIDICTPNNTHAEIAIAAVPDDERVIEVVHGRTYVAGQQIEHLAQPRLMRRMRRAVIAHELPAVEHAGVALSDAP